MSITRVCCILDLDGFCFRRPVGDGDQTRREFLVREMGYVRVDRDMGLDFLSRSFRFDLSAFDGVQDSPKACRTISHQTRKVTGLSFRPEAGERVLPYDERFSCLLRIYESCRQPGLDVVAYKSGDFERELLDRLGIPSLDLGSFGCPTYGQLVARKMVYSQLRDCGHHRRICDAVQLAHCPMAEVTAFRDWLVYHCRTWYWGEECLLGASSIRLSCAVSSSDSSCSDS